MPTLSDPASFVRQYHTIPRQTMQAFFCAGEHLLVQRHEFLQAEVVLGHEPRRRIADIAHVPRLVAPGDADLVRRVADDEAIVRAVVRQPRQKARVDRVHAQRGVVLVDDVRAEAGLMVARAGGRGDARGSGLCLVAGIALAHVFADLILVLLLLCEVRAVGAVDIRAPAGVLCRFEQRVERIDGAGIERGLRTADLAHIRDIVTDIMRLARDEILPGGNIHIRQVVVLLGIGLCRRLDVRRKDQIRRRGGRGVAARLIDAREDEHGAHDDQDRQRHRQPETFVLHADPSRMEK